MLLLIFFANLMYASVGTFQSTSVEHLNESVIEELTPTTEECDDSAEASVSISASDEPLQPVCDTSINRLLASIEASPCM